jgi:ABC-type phosphate transport system permease subunit
MLLGCCDTFYRLLIYIMRMITALAVHIYKHIHNKKSNDSFRIARFSALLLFVLSAGFSS